MDLTPYLPQIQPILGTGIEIGLLVLGLALSAAAGLLLTPALTRNPVQRTSTAPVLAERGAFIPYMLGVFRLGCVFAWVGKASITTKKTGGILGFGSTKTKVTKQGAWHIICVGPAHRLNRIYQSGKIIFPITGESPLNSTTSPSGTKYTTKSKNGSFRIYWGEATQPSDPLLSASTAAKIPGLGVASGFPNVCSIVWIDKVLQVANQWPEMNYEVEVRPIRNDDVVDGETWDDGVPLETGSPFRRENGCIPTHAIAHIMAQQYPQGVGIPAANIDKSFFNAMATILTTEGILSTVLVQNGNHASAAINDILQDIGGIMPQIGDKLIIFLIRKDNAPPNINIDVLHSPLTEKAFIQGDRSSDRNTYVYKDRQLNFRDSDITVDDDAYMAGRPKAITIPLNSIIDQAIANLIVDRKQVEGLVDVRSYTITGGRQLRALSPGQVFFTADLGQVRITSVERKDQSSAVVVECVQDIYSPSAGSPVNYYGDSVVKSAKSSLVEHHYPDAALFMWIVPFDLVPPGSDFSDCWVQFFPIRSTDYTHTNSITTTFDTTPAPVYNQADTIQALFILGLLTTIVNDATFAVWDSVYPISSDDLAVEINLTNHNLVDINGNPFTAVLDWDVAAFPDLTNYPERWRSGENCCAIEDQFGIFREVIYFKSITASPNVGCYYLNGILRNRVIKDANPNGEFSGRVVLFRKQDVAPVNFPNHTTGIPWSPTNVMRSQSNAIAANGDIQTTIGNAVVTARAYCSFIPLAPANFRSSDADLGYYRYSWAAGADVLFKWTNRPLLDGIGKSAGTQLAGISGDVATVPPDGILHITIYDNKINLNLKRTFAVASGVSQAYTNAQLVTDFGAVVGGFSSFYATYQVDVNGFLGTLFGQTFKAR